MIVRKLRLQKGWTQEHLAELTGLSVRSIQRIERGHKCSLETQTSLAAVFEVDLSTFQSGETMMSTEAQLSEDEKDAIEYVKGIKEFYNHLFMFLGFAVVFIGAFGFAFGFTRWPVSWMYIGFIGWGIGVVVHGLNAYELINFFGPKWEKKVIEKRLGRKL